MAQSIATRVDFKPYCSSFGAMNMLTLLRRRAAIAVCVTLSACAAAPPDRPTEAGTAYGAFLAGRYAEAQQDPAAAAGFFEKAVAADPANPDLVGEGLAAALLAGAPGAVSLAPLVSHNALAIMLLGNQAALNGDYGGAARRFATLPQDDLAGVIQPLLVAWAEAGAGNQGAALAGLARYFSGSNLSLVYVLNAALIADVGGDPHDAAGYYAAAGSGGATQNLRLAQILASWQARQGQMQGAQAQLAALLADHPDLQVALPALKAAIAKPVITKPTDGLAEAYLTFAGLLDQPQQVTVRVTFLRFALALRPDLAAARLLLASVQEGDNAGNAAADPARLEAALATLRPVPADDPLYGPVAMQEATLLAALNRPEEAVAVLNRLAAADPGDPTPLAAAADVLRDDNQFKASAAAYDKAIALTGQPPPPAAWSLYFDRGMAEDQSGDWKAAEPDMLEALSLAPNQPYLLNYLGYSWALRGEKLDQARRMLQQAVGLDPNDGAVIDSLGFVSLRQGRKAEAIGLLTQAVELDPDDAEVNAHLGDAFWANGMKLQAGYQWQRALSLKPDPKLQNEIEAKLKQAGRAG